MSKDSHPANAQGKGQATRLTLQHLRAGGVVGIFGTNAQSHEMELRKVAEEVYDKLIKSLPHLTFRMRRSIAKQEIHKKLNLLNPSLGVKLFVESANIKPDGGIIEVKDLNEEWRLILVSEAKYQGKDAHNIPQGIRTDTMAQREQYIMPAGNAIERVHKNIQELKNFMMSERHFPYVVFLQGSNFATKEQVVNWPDGKPIKISPNDSLVNRIDRVTASNYGMPVNTNLCKNTFVNTSNGQIMLQSASIYAQCAPFEPSLMADILWDVSLSSLEVLADELPTKLTPNA